MYAKIKNDKCIEIVVCKKNIVLTQVTVWYVKFSSYLGNGKIWNFCNVAIVEGANSIEGCCDGNGRKHKDGEADLKYYSLCFSQTKVDTEILVI